MKTPTVIFATIAAVLLFIVGGQYMYITKVQRDSAAWSERARIELAQNALLNVAMDSIARRVAIQDVEIARLREDGNTYRRQANRNSVKAAGMLAEARDTSKAAQDRVKRYEGAIEAMSDQISAQVAVIGTQEREIEALETVWDQMEDALDASLARVQELEALVKAAPAVQAPEGSGGLLKKVGGFLAGVGVGVVTGLVLR